MISLPTSVSSVNDRVSAMSSWAKAILPSGLICCGLSYGLVTVMSPLPATNARRSSRVARTSGSSKPCSLRATICAVNPARSGAFASSNCCTCFVSLSGKLKSVLKSGPIAPATALTATSRTTQAPMTIQRWRVHARARRGRKSESLLGLALVFTLCSDSVDRRAGVPTLRGQTEWRSRFHRPQRYDRTPLGPGGHAGFLPSVMGRAFGAMISRDAIRLLPVSVRLSTRRTRCPFIRTCSSRAPHATR